MTLLDKYLPRYDFVERHSRVVNAGQVAVFDVASAYDPQADAFFKAMVAFRGLPMRLSAARRGGKRPASFGLHSFCMLERRDGEELVLGLVGRFWRSSGNLVAIADGDAFRAFDEPGIAKLAVSFRAAGRQDGRTILATETRVFCPDRASRLRFTPYWYLIRPISGLIRRRILSSIKKRSEDGNTRSATSWQPADGRKNPVSDMEGQPPVRP